MQKLMCTSHHNTAQQFLTFFSLEYIYIHNQIGTLQVVCESVIIFAVYVGNQWGIPACQRGPDGRRIHGIKSESH